ncbi:hypothetical protein MMC28_006266 [Mycoblastus sanguinarius]|nr:hypothetical protein [Mycoblastus sanguinarius]
MKSNKLNALALTCIAGALPTLAQQCSTVDNVFITFYGWPDNSPPGADNAFDCGRGKGPDGEPIAGGTGTYTDPISFATATDNTNLPQCGMVYLPWLHKYFRNEDDCENCTGMWDSSKTYHIDLWTGSNTQGGGDNQINCEDSLPGGFNTIIKNPPNGLPVDTTPLYDVSSNQCYSTTYPTSDDSGLCSGGGGGEPSAPASSQSSTVAATTTSISVSKPLPAPTTPGGGGGSTPTTFYTLSTTSSAAEASCTWAGHCLGSPCQTYDDCDGTNICSPSNICVPMS